MTGDPMGPRVLREATVEELARWRGNVDRSQKDTYPAHPLALGQGTLIARAYSPYPAPTGYFIDVCFSAAGVTVGLTTIPWEEIVNQIPVDKLPKL